MDGEPKLDFEPQSVAEPVRSIEELESDSAERSPQQPACRPTEESAQEPAVENDGLVAEEPDGQPAADESSKAKPLVQPAETQAAAEPTAVALVARE